MYSARLCGVLLHPLFVVVYNVSVMETIKRLRIVQGLLILSLVMCLSACGAKEEPLPTKGYFTGDMKPKGGGGGGTTTTGGAAKKPNSNVPGAGGD
jgi:hypothetical protein